MVTNHKVTGRASSMPIGLATGLGASMGATLIMSGIFAYLIGSETISEEAIGYGAMLILVLSSAAGALVAVRQIKRQRLAVCLLSGAIYYITLLSTTALLFGGEYRGMGVTALVVFAGVGMVILCGLRENRGAKRPFKKHKMVKLNKNIR